MDKYRIECNFGSKYFDVAAEAFAFFHTCKAKRIRVEIWLVQYRYIARAQRYAATQELLEYSGTEFPK